MSNANNAITKNLAELARENYFFSIPPYQRLYEWEDTHIKELLNDMLKAHKSKSKNADSDSLDSANQDSSAESKGSYFIGNIVVSRDKADKTNETKKEFVLIDGQQRLTTLFLIGFYLAKNCQDSDKWKKFIFDKDKDKLRISMPCREIEEKELRNLAENITNTENLENKLTGNFKNALKHIVEWLGNNKEINLNDFAEFIYNNVKFVFVKLAQDTDLNRFFVRMNNRGKQLEKHEILKARLLKQIFDGDNINKKGEYHIYAKIWDICSDMNKYIFQSAADRNIFKKAESEKTYNTEKESKQNDATSLYDIISDKSKLPSEDNQNLDDAPENYKSIVDFPTFLLHVFKIAFDNKASIDKGKLLDIIKIESNNAGEKDEADMAKRFIQHLLFYRVLFDYFVVKEKIDSKEGGRYKIRRLCGNDKKGFYVIEQLSEKDDKAIYPKLSMVQNYLRVARAGDSQNYHHWLTPFLKYLGGVLQDEDISEMRNGLNICETSKNETIDIQNITQIVIAKDKTTEQLNNPNQDDLVNFLENLDTALACVQYENDENRFSEGSDKSKYSDLLKITNKALQECNQKKMDNIMQDKVKSLSEYEKIENTQWEFLDKGTDSPRYWFYRLEYYLWKWQNGDIVKIFQSESEEKNTQLTEDFKKIAENFYFRNLNSIEHIQPQSKQNENGWDANSINKFGNLALISLSFNASLNAQDTQYKEIDLEKKGLEGNVESLKLWIVYKQFNPKTEGWNPTKAETHKNQMLEILKNSFAPTITAQPNQTQNPQNPTTQGHTCH